VAAGLAGSLVDHWRSLRGRTYDFLNSVAADDLGKRLPFPESQPVFYQLWCMTGAQESWLALLTTGEWAGFSSSLRRGMAPAEIKMAMQAADARQAEALGARNPEDPFANGSTMLQHYLALVEHESHHHGQLINLIYANNLPIAESWAAKWALSRE
jgi:hypothetical protein